MAKQKYYAVRKGYSAGIFLTWDDCKAQTDGFPNAEYKSFATINEAAEYLKADKTTGTTNIKSSKKKNTSVTEDIMKSRNEKAPSFSKAGTKKKKFVSGKPRRVEQKITYEQLNADQKNAYDIMELGGNVFLSGEAGTGKSYLINCFLQNHKNKNVIVCAPTGIAALQVHGTTIHRLFQVKPGPVSPHETLKKLDDKILAADIIVMDEVSMCRFDLFSIVCRYIDKAARMSRQNKQFIVVGDFHQLPPIIAPRETDLLKELWNGLIDTEDFTGYAFESPQWAKMNFQHIVLTEIMRQDSGSEFTHYLNMIRKGNTEGIDWINRNATKDTQPGVFLYGRNAAADEKNTAEIAKLKQKMVTYHSETSGDFKERDYPTNSDLQLCVGARVMSLINDPSNAYQNGSLGTVTAVTEKKVTVEFDNGRISDIEPYEWQATDYATSTDPETGKVMIEEETVGTFTQLPLRIAFAITIHKSQGQTYDSVNLDPNCFSVGQLYVALSRVVDIEHLHLLKPIKPKDLKTDQKVIDFYS